MTQIFLGYSLTVSKDEIVAIHEAAVLTNTKKAAKIVGTTPAPQKSLCCIFMNIYLFFFQTETNVVPWDAPIAVGILLVATDVYAQVVTIPPATTVQVNVLLPYRVTVLWSFQ